MKSKTESPAASPRAGAGAVPGLYVVVAIVFCAGALGMVLELLGSRLLAPFFGNSLFVWTSLIGVMLGFMSLGYYLGGRLADRHLGAKYLFWILMGAAFAVALIAVTQSYLLPLLAGAGTSKAAAVFSAVLLFAIPSTLLGMVSPYCIRLRMHTVEDSGTTIGSLYAISTLGSIVGTFAAGFWLIALFGTRDLVMLVALALALLSLLVAGKAFRTQALVALLVLVPVLGYVKIAVADTSIDTQYDRYFVRAGVDPTSGRPLIGLSRDNKTAESVSYADTGAPYRFEYYNYYDLARTLHGPLNRTLLIGGATLSYPRLFISANPTATMDVVEIDPELYTIAKNQFGYVDDPRLHLYFEDGRTFLNRATGPYDAVYMDAFKSKATVPYQLTTKETWQHAYDALGPDGVLVMNIVASPSDSRKAFFNSTFASISSVFPEVRAFRVDDYSEAGGITNTSIVAMKRKGADIDALLAKRAPDKLARMYAGYQPPAGTKIFTDDFAPVDQYLLGF